MAVVVLLLSDHEARSHRRIPLYNGVCELLPGFLVFSQIHHPLVGRSTLSTFAVKFGFKIRPWTIKQSHGTPPTTIRYWISLYCHTFTNARYHRVTSRFTMESFGAYARLRTHHIDTQQCVSRVSAFEGHRWGRDIRSGCSNRWLRSTLSTIWPACPKASGTSTPASSARPGFDMGGLTLWQLHDDCWLGPAADFLASRNTGRHSGVPNFCYRTTSRV